VYAYSHLPLYGLQAHAVKKSKKKPAVLSIPQENYPATIFPIFIRRIKVAPRLGASSPKPEAIYKAI
jgi:hypothetical protein